MERLQLWHAVILVYSVPFLATAEVQQREVEKSPPANVIENRAVGTFQGISRFRVPPVPVDSQYFIVEQFCDHYGPAVRLANGKVFRLAKTAASCAGGPINVPSIHPGDGVPKINVAPKPRADRSGGFDPLTLLSVSRVYAQTQPPAVSLAAQQTSFKSQGLRDTCTYYATIAGLEAAYKHKYGIDLDLSERHLNARFKMSLFTAGTALPNAEVISSAWDGGYIESILRVMTDQAIGVPPESAQPETSAGENFSTPDPGDDPDLQGYAPDNPASKPVTQRAMDDFNLRDILLHMKTPDPLDIVPLPEDALVQARYLATSITIAGPGDLTSLDWYRSQIAAGHEVIVQFHCCDGFKTGPVSHNVGGGAAHAALLVGYDDDVQEFQMKNSWGENTFLRFAYDNITGGSIYQAGAILDVASPIGPFSARDNPQAFVGRWLLSDSGQIGARGEQPGILDIYLSPINPDIKRIGTFFSPSGSAYRVNGFADKGTLRFFIDQAQPNLPEKAVDVGRQYTAYLFDDKRTMMTGDVMLLASGPVRGFLARKSEALPTTPVVSRANLSDPQRVLFGDWRIILENESGDLLISRFNASSGNFEGTYNPDQGTPYNAYASLQGDSFAAWTDAPTAASFRLFSGHFADTQKRIVAGYGNGYGSGYGVSVGQPFVAVLASEVITIPAASGTLGPPAK